MGGMTAGHFVFIPAVLLFGLVIGWILGSRAAADAYAAELKRREERAGRSSATPGGRTSKGPRGATESVGLLLAVAVGVALAGCGSVPGEAPDGASPTAAETVDVRRRVFDLDPVAIEALVAGDEGGQVVVLLPGSGLGASSFLNFLPRLAEAGLRPVALNPRGIEASFGPLDNLTLHDLAADVAGVIEQLDVGPVFVLGHGFGNRVARCLATDRPESVEGLILLGAGGQVEGDPEAVEGFTHLYAPDLTHEETVVALQTALFAPGSDASVWADLPVFPAVWRAQQSADLETPNEEWLFGGSAPILIIQGRHDRLSPPENGRWLRERLGERVQLIELANSGHALLPEQPAEVAEAIVDFVSP